MSEDELEPDSPCAEIEKSDVANAIEVQRQRIAEAYGQIEAPLLSSLRSRVGSMHEARDIVQEAWLKVLAVLMQRPGTVNSLQALLWTTAQNIAKDRWRKGTYRADQELVLASEIDSTSPSLSPEFACIASQRLEIVQKAITELPPKCRSAFQLHFFENLEFAEIAKRLQIHITGARKYVKRAIAHCQLAVDAAEQAKRSDI